MAPQADRRTWAKKKLRGNVMVSKGRATFAAGLLAVFTVQAAFGQQAPAPYGSVMRPGVLVVPEEMAPVHYDFGLATQSVTPSSWTSQSVGQPPQQTANYGLSPIQAPPAPPGVGSPRPLHMASQEAAQAPATPAVDQGAFDQALDAEPCDSCGACDTCDPCCGGVAPYPPCPWFASAAALFMTRDRPNPSWTTFESGNNPNQLMNTADADAGWGWGGEIRFGRYFGCCRSDAIEGVFWALEPLEGFASIASPSNQLSTPYDLNGVSIGANVAGVYFDNASEQRIWRDDRAVDVEINWWHYFYGSQFQPVQLASVLGVRYFRFDDDLVFGSSQGGFSFGDDGGIREAYLNVDVQNYFVGPQIGGRADFWLTPRFGIYGMPLFGIYGHQANVQASMYRGDGLLADADGVPFDFRGSKTDVSFIGQFDLGVEWQCLTGWGVFAAYRVIAVSGIALADNQIPHFMVDQAEWEDPDTNGNLILHGLVMGIQYNY
jgi:hypothetical protein